MSSTRTSGRSARVDFRELKDRITLLQVLEHYDWRELLQEKADGGFEGPCPLHSGEIPDARSRSFKVTPSLRGFKCFGCKARGSIIDLVATKEGKGYLRAANLIHEWFSPKGEASTKEEGQALIAAATQQPAAEQLTVYGDQEGLIGFFYGADRCFRGHQIIADAPIGIDRNTFTGLPEILVVAEAKRLHRADQVVLVLKKHQRHVSEVERDALRVCCALLGHVAEESPAFLYSSKRLYRIDIA